MSSRKLTTCPLVDKGAGESGKSTILKQMKIIHLNGFSRSELDGYKPIVVRNVLESIRNLIHAIDRFGIEFGSAIAKVGLSQVKTFPIQTPRLPRLASPLLPSPPPLSSPRLSSPPLSSE